MWYLYRLWRGDGIGILDAGPSRKGGICGSGGSLIEDLNRTATAPGAGGWRDIIVTDQTEREDDGGESHKGYGLSNTDVRGVPSWDLGHTLRTSRHGCTARNESADEKATSPSDRMKFPFRLVLGDGNARGIRDGSAESSISIQLIYRCPDCQ